MTFKTLLHDNKKLVTEFGANLISELKEIPDYYTFKNNLFYSHRDFDLFLKRLKTGEKSAIVSGFNASGSIHLGHKAVFDTNLFFQKEYGLDIFIPISDDESYVSNKVDTQETAYAYSLNLVKQLIAYGFNPKKTFFIIDQVYTDIYNYAIMLSKKINYATAKATYGFNNESNLGLIFYPTIQSAHILFPQFKFNIKNVLVPIGPDEDNHFRISRDLAAKFNLVKPATIHSTFLPGIDGLKMSKSKNNFILLTEDEKSIIKKVNKTLSGGRDTLEEHKKHGAIIEKDISLFYLEKYFLSSEEYQTIKTQYAKGEIPTSYVKNLLKEKLITFANEFQKKLDNLNLKEIENSILKNETKIIFDK